MAKQHSESARIFREALARKNLRLAALDLPDDIHRLAWLALWVPKFPSSGIVHCLNVHDALIVAQWLQSRGISAAAHHGKLDIEQRASLESKLLNHQIKVLVSTFAMGPRDELRDLGFVIHFQNPGSIAAYFSQVVVGGYGAGGGYGILLTGAGGEAEHDNQLGNALPDAEPMSQVLQTIERCGGLTQRELSHEVNWPWGVLSRAVHVLEAAGLLVRDDRGWKRTTVPWNDQAYRAQVEQAVASARRDQELMRNYCMHRDCLMRFLTRAIDDPQSEDCGRCINCQSKTFPTQVPETLRDQAAAFLDALTLEIPVRLRWPLKLPGHESTTIAYAHRHEAGRCLCVQGRGAWGRAVHRGRLETGQFDDTLASAAVELVRNRWNPQPAPAWVTCIPSLRRPQLVPELAQRIAREMGLPFVASLHCRELVPEQKTQKNSAFQMRNAMKSLCVVVGLRPGPVLLVDDVVDSGWTITVASMLLRQAGAGAVFPLALARVES